MQIQSSTQTIQTFAASLTQREQGFSTYHDRRVSPAETFDAISPFFRDLGITRVGFLTGLDRVGIPVAFATRPNSHTLSVFQGKGVDADAARTSAAMEALETRVAEIEPTSLTWATVNDVAGSAAGMIDLHSTARCVPSEIGDGQIPWVTGLDILSGNQVMVPWWLAGMDHRGERPAGFEQSSDGLASGNTHAEALLHGLCELVERDAWTLVQLKSEQELNACLVDPASVEDAVLDLMVRRLRNAGIQLLLLDMTTDLQVPAFLAVLIPDSTAKRSDPRWSQICGGCGCHPDPVRAMLRAITEAAQSRLTAIAGSRDDFSPRIYQHMRGTTLSAAWLPCRRWTGARSSIASLTQPATPSTARSITYSPVSGWPASGRSLRFPCRMPGSLFRSSASSFPAWKLNFQANICSSVSALQTP